MSTSYYQICPSLSALAGYGASSPLVANADVLGVGRYSWDGADVSSPDGFFLIQATGVANGRWVLDTPDATFVPLETGEAAAAENSSRLAAASANGGLVVLRGAGECYVSETFMLGDNISVYHPIGLSLKNLPTNNFPVVETTAARSAFTNVAITWTDATAMLASIAWPAHGKSKGGYIWLKGTAGVMPGEFFGVFRIQSITDANNFVISLWRIPSAAPSGQAIAKDANVNVSYVGGGLIDYNKRGGAGSGTGNALDQMGALLVGVQNFVFDAQVQDSISYTLSLGALADAKIRAGFPIQDKDACKLLGPALNVEFSQLWGTSGDDFFSMQPLQDPPFAGGDYTGGGDILNCSVANVNAIDAGAGVHLYGADWFLLDAIRADNISFSPRDPITNANTAFEIHANTENANGTPISSTKIGRIYVSNVGMIDSSTIVGGGVLVVSLSQIEELVVDGVTVPNFVQAGGGLSAGFHSRDDGLGAPSIGVLKLRNFTGAPSDSSFNTVRVENTTVGQFEMENFRINQISGQGNIVNLTSGTFSNIVVRGFETNNAETTLLIQNGVLGTPDVLFENNVSTDVVGVETFANCTVIRKNNHYSSATAGAILTIAADVKLIDDGSNTIINGSLTLLPGVGSLDKVVMPEQSLWLQGNGFQRGVYVSVGTGDVGPTLGFATSPNVGDDDTRLVYGNANPLRISRANSASIDPAAPGAVYTDHWSWDNNGFFIPATDNLKDIGADALRIRRVYTYDLRQAPVTLASLGSAAGLGGARSMVSDLTVYTPGSVAAGGGAIIGPVFSNGANWIMG